jgi:MmyB-like transcription regulator ligand binding domain
VGRGFIHRWFTEPAIRSLVPAEDHRHFGRALVADLRLAGGLRAKRLVAVLLAASDEFAELWAADSWAGDADRARFVHPTLGVIELEFARLSTDDPGQRLVWFTAPPGSAAVDQLAMLNVIGVQDLWPDW